MWAAGVLFVVLSIASQTEVTQSRGIDLGLCSNENVVCDCGSTGGLQINVPIKRCTHIHKWKFICKPCERYNRDALCSQFRQCLSCNAERDGGCSACPAGRYGSNCQGVCQCQNGGVCDATNGQCKCLPYYSGTFCEKSLRSTCGQAPGLRNGEVGGNTGGNVREGSVVSYRCNAGYALVGPREKRCEKSGVWSGGEARCEYTCAAPSNKPKLSVDVKPYVTMPTPDNPQGVELIRRVTFSCQAGYTLQGPSELNCLPTSQWNGAVPSCVQSCGSPPTVQNGKFEGNSYVEGSQVNYYCSKGFMMTGDPFLLCRNGQWVGTIPTCSEPVPVTCAAPTFDGQIQPVASSYTAGSTIVLTCNGGSTLDGASSLTCQQNGQWSAAVPTCVAVTTTCPELQAPQNGVVSEASGPFNVGQKVQFTCNIGYILDGSSERQCLQDGSWSGTLTRCTKILTCADPGVPKNGRRVISPTTTGRRSRGPGSRNRIGRVRIPHSGVSPNVPAGQFVVNTEFTFTCTPRIYNLVGSQKRSCQANGQWSGEQPRCVPVCGKSPGARVTRIIRGEVSKVGDYPWQVMLAQLQFDSVFVGVCGGSLISEDWVATAAHCVTQLDTTTLLSLSMIKIYLGKYYRDNSKDDAHVQEFSITEIHISPNYNPITLDSDIALLRLSSSAVLSDRVMPVCLPDIALSNELLSPGNFVSVTGWGETENKTDAEVLLSTRLQTITNGACERRYAATNNALVVTDQMFCAGHDDARSDTCFGDSGGPAVAYKGSGLDREWFLVGVISWGSPVDCGVEMHYSGFTKISSFLEFIRSTAVPTS